MTYPISPWTIKDAYAGDPDAHALLHDYLAEVAARWYGRTPTLEDILTAYAEHPENDLDRTLIGCYQGTPAGCVGIRLIAAGIAEITRLFITRAFRNLGGGRALLAAAEEAASVELGVHTVLLDAQLDIPETRRLFTARGYEPFGLDDDDIGPYAHLYGRRLHTEEAT